MANIPESWVGDRDRDTWHGGLGGCRYHHLWYPRPGSLFRSSPKLLHRASGPACRYAGHKSIPSNIQYLSSPPSLPSLRCRMLLFWGRCGKTVHKERDTIAAIFVLDLLNLGEVIYKNCSVFKLEVWSPGVSPHQESSLFILQQFWCP